MKNSTEAYSTSKGIAAIIAAVVIVIGSSTLSGENAFPILLMMLGLLLLMYAYIR